MINFFFTKTPLKYDGSQLSSLWPYSNFGISGDCVALFRGPCEVTIKKMVDMEDVLNNAPIYSEDMLHFIIEHFDTMDLEKIVTRQRLLISIIAETINKQINEKNFLIERAGDDLYQGVYKLSVSIATLTPVSSMIHTGLNVSSNNTPVPTIGLSDLGFSDSHIALLGQKIACNYINELQQIKLARSKVRGVG